ncbi:MAG TPA: ABC transporter permease [Longimicrobiales bacterium]|nr:ABC transporter permease [Longimicrobiales bacterium]
MLLLKEIVLVALAAIRANALRSFLTMLGIIIGVAAVIAMVALGEGAQQRVQDEIQRMGTNVLTIRPGQQMFGGVHWDSGVRLTLDDARALRDSTSGFLTVAPEIESRQQITYLRWNSSNQIVGTWPEYFGIYDLKLLDGRIFDPGEVQGRRRVAVLGYNVPEEDLGTPRPLLMGKTIQIGGQPFEVIGILAEKGDAAWFRPDDQIFIPATTGMYRVFGGRERLGSIYAAPPDPEGLDAAYADIDRILRRQHRIGPGEEADYSIRNSADLLETFNETNRVFSYLLAGIAGVSLLVGGIGIMNIMLVSVTERTKEIGVRKAMGATRKAILLQFLIEALVLCVLGGAAGVAAGWGGARLITRIADWQTAVSMVAVVGALGFSAGIGLFFGIWPAQRAAALDPIDALRYE